MRPTGYQDRSRIAIACDEVMWWSGGVDLEPEITMEGAFSGGDIATNIHCQSANEERDN